MDSLIASAQRCAREGLSNMAKCAYCGTTIIFGGTREGELRFCNDECRNAGVILTISQQIPETLIWENALQIHQGNCPLCGSTGPVDVHVSYRVWSALVVTSWSSRPRVSCRSCATMRQIGDAVFSLVLGWWGFPWGFIITPVQVGRNVIRLARPPDPSKPSAQLENFVRMAIAEQVNSHGPGEG